MNSFQQFIQGNVLVIFLATFAVFLLVFLWIVVLHLKVRKLERKNKELFAGNKVANLEDLIINQTKGIKSLDRDIQELFNISNQINKLAFHGLHKIGIVRFNPFKDVGGNQSFAIAILNGKNNGITLSSLYTREGTRIYSKSIAGGKTEKHPLTEEEKQAIEMAMSSEHNKLK